MPAWQRCAVCERGGGCAALLRERLPNADLVCPVGVTGPSSAPVGPAGGLPAVRGASGR